MQKKAIEYTLAQLEDRADWYGLRMHRGEEAVQKWLSSIHEAAQKRTTHRAPQKSR